MNLAKSWLEGVKWGELLPQVVLLLVAVAFYAQSADHLPAGARTAAQATIGIYGTWLYLRNPKAREWVTPGSPSGLSGAAPLVAAAAMSRERDGAAIPSEEEIEERIRAEAERRAKELVRQLVEGVQP